MNLQDYLSASPSPTPQRDLARQLGVHESLISLWVTHRARIIAERAVQIEAATGGAVHRSELRPDLWPPIQKDND